MRPRLPLSPLLALLLAAPAPAHAAWSPAPSGTVVSAAFSDQHLPQVLADGAGGAFVVWADLRTGDFDIRAQRIGPAGQPLWDPQGVVVCTAPGQQDRPRIVADAAGGCIVVWEDTRTGGVDLYAQRVNAAGVLQWAAPGVVVCAAADEQSEASVVADGAGGVVVAWTDLRSGVSTDIYAQRLSATGLPQWTANGVALCVAAGDQYDPSACADGSGGAVVAWNDLRAPAHLDVFAQRLSGGGSALWTSGGVRLCETLTGQSSPVAVGDGAGGAVVAWHDGRNGASDIAAQRVDASGLRLWGTTGVLACVAPGVQSEVAAHAAPGGTVLAWQDARGASVDLYAQRLDASGAAQWGAGGVPVCTAPGPQDQPAVHEDGAGGTLVAWQDRRGATLDIAAQRLDAAGSPLWVADGVLLCTATGSQSFPAVTGDGNGGAVVAWEDARAFQTDIYAHRVFTTGVLGGPEPRIVALADVPEDDGGQLTLTFTASLYEQAGLGVPLTGYRVERLDAGGPEVVVAIDPDGSAEYTVVVPTLADSTPAAVNRTRLQVVAFGPGGSWTSASDSLASRDELPPPRLEILQGRWDPVLARATLDWRAPSPDAVLYHIHRSTFATFVATVENRIATTSDTTWSDSFGQLRWYRVAPVDASGNIGGSQFVLPVETVGVGPVGAALALSRPAPEPSRGPLTLQFSLPAAGPARLELFDEQGRRVRTLHDGMLAAGPHAVRWDGRDDAGRAVAPGVLHARLTHGSGVRTERVTRLR
jgi:hypothetical protein